MLADALSFTAIGIDLGVSKTIDCIGIGYTDATNIEVNGQNIVLDSVTPNGLYQLTTPITANVLHINLKGGTYAGRIAVGKSRQIGISPAREPGFGSSQTSRTTLSGQTIPGVGGVTWRKIQVDVRYKFTRDIFEDIERSYPSQLSRNYPLFISFDDQGSENYPWNRLYASTDTQWLFQSSVNKFLYSKKMNFEERF